MASSVHGRLEVSFGKLRCRVSKPYVAVVVALSQHKEGLGAFRFFFKHNMFNTTTSISGKITCALHAGPPNNFSSELNYY